MPLDTATIIRRLAAASWQQKDNEAQNIINGASSAELKNLNAEGVLRLYEALALLPTLWYSSNDVAAMNRLKAETQFQPVTNTPEYGVALVNNARKTLNYHLVTSQLVTNIYTAESKRFSWEERAGFDADTIGRGQVGQPAYTDVKSPRYFKDALETCVTRVFIAELLAYAPETPLLNIDFSSYSVKIPQQYRSVISYPAIEDFVVAAYLAIRIHPATKNGRSLEDTLRFAVAVYHGMYEMVFNAQTAVKDEIKWAPVEAELISKGYTDDVNYVNEVVK